MLSYTISKTITGSWLFSWVGESSDDIFEIWLEGELLAEVSLEEYTFTGPNYDLTPPPLEIIVSGTIAENDTNPPYLLLQWRRIAGALYYQIEQYVDTAWVLRERLAESDSEYYGYYTAVLPDCTITQWRVSALNSLGDEGVSVSFSSYLVRNPPPPEVVIDYAAGAVVVSES